MEESEVGVGGIGVIPSRLPSMVPILPAVEVCPVSKSNGGIVLPPTERPRRGFRGSTGIRPAVGGGFIRSRRAVLDDAVGQADLVEKLEEGVEDGAQE
jgi:hypothetical protein